MILHKFFHQSVVETEFPQSRARDRDGEPRGAVSRCRPGQGPAQTLVLTRQSREDPSSLGGETAIRSRILAWKIP